MLCLLPLSGGCSVYDGFDGLCMLALHGRVLLLARVHLSYHCHIVSSHDVQSKVDALCGLAGREHTLVGVVENEVESLVEAAQNALSRQQQRHQQTDKQTVSETRMGRRGLTPSHECAVG